MFKPKDKSKDITSEEPLPGVEEMEKGYESSAEDSAIDEALAPKGDDMEQYCADKSTEQLQQLIEIATKLMDEKNASASTDKEEII